MFICTKCHKRYSIEENIQRCECGEPVELEFQEGDKKGNGCVWKRYDEFFPLKIKDSDSLGEGDTPLIKADTFSKDFNIDLYLKNETVNPTWSFKDRGTVFGIKRVKKLGVDTIGTVSTGNMGASVAAYGSKNDMITKVLVSSHISREKLVQIGIYDPDIIKVKGNYGDLYFRSLDIGKKYNIYFINSDDPFRIEGYKSISYEIIDEIQPDYVVLPTSSGGLFRGIAKGFIELKKSKLLERLPTLIAVQAEGCSPIYDAYDSYKNEIKKEDNPKTIAKAIANPYPPSGNEVLRKLYEFDWQCIKVGNDEIIEGQKKIAKEGIFCQLASATVIAGLEKLINKNKIKKQSKVVCIVTGSGLKQIPESTFKIDVDESEIDEIEDLLYSKEM